MRKVFDRIMPLAVLLVFALLMLTIVRTSVFGAVEEEKHVYFEIVFLLLLAVAGEIAVLYFRQPSVMVLMVLGILMSQSFLSSALDFMHGLDLPFALPQEPPELFRSEQMIHLFAQLGAIVLLFKVGLHSRMEGIFAMDNLLVALGGIIVPFAAGYAYAALTGGSFAYSMFLAAALTATSVGVTVAVLREMNLVAERFAQIIIGAAVLDDILSLLVLSFVLNLSGGGGSLESVALTTLTAGIFIAGSILAGRYFIAYLDRKELNPRRFLMVLALMLLFAYVAEFIRLSAIVGAFMAGLMLNRSRHLKEIEDKTYGLEMLFMPIFFITLGMLVDVHALVDYAWAIAAITIIAIVTKVIGSGGGAILAKLGRGEALAIGAGMSPRGEVALIVASIGLTSGSLGISEYSVISMMALLTTFLAVPLLGRALRGTRAA